MKKKTCFAVPFVLVLMLFMNCLPVMAAQPEEVNTKQTGNLGVMSDEDYLAQFADDPVKMAVILADIAKTEEESARKDAYVMAAAVAFEQGDIAKVDELRSAYRTNFNISGQDMLAIRSKMAFGSTISAAETASYNDIILPMTWYRQINGWYCGPASVQMSLSTRGIYYDQGTLGSLIGTTQADGSYGGNMKNVIQNITGYVWGYRDSPIDGNNSLLYSRVIWTLGDGYVPMTSVYQYEGGNKYRLNGHTNQYLRHWVPIYGTYLDETGGWNGQYYSYGDSASGLGGRFAAVPQKSNIHYEAMGWLNAMCTVIY